MKIKLYQCGGSSGAISEYPLGLGYLKTNCEGDIQIVKDSMELKNCDIIGLSSNAWGASEAVCILNSTDIPVVIGGEITLWEGLEKFNFHHIVKGEGELAFKSILQGKEKDKIVVKNEIDNMDSLNFPDRGICDEEVPILSSRGCPFKCNFCATQKFWKKVRSHSPEYFISEVEYLLKIYPNMKRLNIRDDLFISSKKRFYEIFDIWMSKNLHKRLELNSHVRSDIFDKNIALSMKAMGFISFRFGAESGSDRMLKLLNKQSTVADHQRTIDICNEIGLPVSAGFIHNAPGERLEDKKLTYDFQVKNKDKLRCMNYNFVPFPGTKFYNNEDLLEKDMRIFGRKSKNKNSLKSKIFERAINAKKNNKG